LGHFFQGLNLSILTKTKHPLKGGDMHLTKTELFVVKELSEGFTHKEIAKHRGGSYRTVKSHCNAVVPQKASFIYSLLNFKKCIFQNYKLPSKSRETEFLGFINKYFVNLIIGL